MLGNGVGINSLHAPDKVALASRRSAGASRARGKDNQMARAIDKERAADTAVMARA